MTIEVQEGHPARVGSYVVYTNGPVAKFAERRFMSWDGQRWQYPMSDQYFRDHVYGWIGPLPAMPLES